MTVVRPEIHLRDYQDSGADRIRVEFRSPVGPDAIAFRLDRIEVMQKALQKRPNRKKLANDIAYFQKRMENPNVTSVLCVAPTGAGKGTLAAYVLINASRKGHPSVFIVHTREIVKDVHKRLVNVGAPAGMILAGEPEQPELPIQVCSIGTLIARKKRPPAHFIVWDECHHCVARTYREVCLAYPRARHLGLTATPTRADGSPLGDVFDVMVELATTRELTDRKFLVPALIVSPDAHTGDQLAAHPLDWYREYADQTKAIVFAVSKPEAAAYAQEFNAAGYPAVALDADTPASLRGDYIRLYREGQIRVLCNINVLTEGFDAPETETVILARNYQSVSQYVQASGRGLRSAEEYGKTHLRLLDLVGNHWLHGPPAGDRTWSLFDGSDVLKSAPSSKCQSCGNYCDSWMLADAGPGCPSCGSHNTTACPKCRKPVELVSIELGGSGCPNCRFVKEASEPKRLEVVSRAAQIYKDPQLVEASP